MVSLMKLLSASTTPAMLSSPLLTRTLSTDLFDFYSKYGGFSNFLFLGTTCWEPNIWFSGFTRHPPNWELVGNLPAI